VSFSNQSTGRSRRLFRHRTQAENVILLCESLYCARASIWAGRSAFSQMIKSPRVDQRLSVAGPARRAVLRGYGPYSGMRLMATTSKPTQSLAVLFCDIEGTSGLMAREGDLVVADLLRAFFENAGRLAVEHHCGFMKFIGDAFIAAFDDADRWLPFAFAVQNVTESDPVISDYHFGLRFSLHFGDVVFIETSYGKDIFGEDINIAARLNDLAGPGQVVISQAALRRLSAGQQASVGPSETVRIRKVGDIQIHRLPLTVP